MKISVNDVELFTLTDIQKQVIMDYIPEEIFEEDMKRRLNYVLMHLYDQAYNKLKTEWEPKLIENGIDSFPSLPDKFAALVFGQPNYKSRSARDKGD